MYLVMVFPKRARGPRSPFSQEAAASVDALVCSLLAVIKLYFATEVVSCIMTLRIFACANRDDVWWSLILSELVAIFLHIPSYSPMD